MSTQKPLFGAESERLAAIRARKAAASKGKWRVEKDLDPVDGCDMAIEAGDVRVADVFIPAGVTPEEQRTAEADVEFVANARADVIYLLTLVSRQANQIEQARAGVKALEETVGAADAERDRLEADRDRIRGERDRRDEEVRSLRADVEAAKRGWRKDVATVERVRALDLHKASVHLPDECVRDCPGCAIERALEGGEETRG